MIVSAAAVVTHTGVTVDFDGACDISGDYNVTSATGTKNYGAVTIATTGSFDITVNEDVDVASLSINGAGSISGGHANSDINIAGDLTMAGGTINASFDFNVNVTGQLIVNAGTATIARCDLTVTSFTDINGTIDFATSANGVKTFTRDVTIDGAWTNTINENFSFRENLIVNGTLTAGTGTYSFTGVTDATPQITGTNTSLSFDDIAISAGVDLTFGITNGTISITNGGAASMAGPGEFTLADDTYCTYNGSTVTAVLDVDQNGCTFEYYRTNAQTIYTTIYHHLVISGSNTKTLVGDISVNGNLDISGTASLDMDIYDIIGNASGTFNMDAGTSLLIGNATVNDANVFPSTFTAGNISLDPTSTVTFRADAAQTISSTPTYGNLTLASTNAQNKTPDGSIDVEGTLTINANNTLVVGANTVNVNNGSSIANDGDITATTGTVDISDGGDYTGTGDFNFSGAGNFEVGEDWTNTGAFGHNLTATVTFNGTQATQQVAPAALNFFNLVLNNSTSTNDFNFPNSATVQVLGNLTITSGEAIFGNSEIFTVTGTSSIAGSGSIRYGNNANITLGVSTGMTGAASIVGTDNAGTLNAGALTMDGTSSIGGNNGARTSDVNCSSLTISASATDAEIEDCDFVCSGIVNVNGSLEWTDATGAKTLTGDVTMGGSGVWNNSGNESISFGGSLSHGNAGGGTFTPGSGTYTFTGTTEVFSCASASLSFPNTSVTGSYTNNVTTLSISGTLSVGAAGTFDIGATAVSVSSTGTNSNIINISSGALNFTGDFTNNGTVTVSTTGSIDIADGSDYNGNGSLTFSANGTMEVGDDWNNSGVFTCNNSTVTYNGNAAAQLLGSVTYYNLVLNNTTSTNDFTVTDATTVTINNNFTLTSGELLLDGTEIINMPGTAATGTIQTGGYININANDVTINFNGTGGLIMQGAARIGDTGNNTSDVNSSSLVVDAGATARIGDVDFVCTGAATIDGSLQWDDASGTKTITGDVDIDAAGTWNNSINENITIGGSLTNSGGTFTSGSGTYTLTNAAATGESINSTSGTLTFSGPVDVQGDYTNTVTTLTLSSTLAVSLGTASFIMGATTVNVAGNVTNDGLITISTGLLDIADGSSYNGAGNLTFGGAGFMEVGNDWNNTGTFNSGISSTVTFNGTQASQLIASETMSFYNLVLNNSTSTNNFTITDAVTLSVTNNLTITSGDLIMDNADVLTVTNATSMATGASIYIVDPGTTCTLGTSTFMAGAAKIVGQDNNGIVSCGVLTMDGSAYIGDDANNRTYDVTCTSLSVAVTAIGVQIDDCDFTCSGTATIDGSLTWPDNAGTKTITGDVTVNATGTWNNSGNESFTLGEDLTVADGTDFTSGSGVYSFTGAATRTINCTTGALTIYDVDVTNALQNNVDVLTITNDLTGAGTFINPVNKTLYIGDDCTVNVLTATANPNTIRYNGSNAQTAKATNYHHLIVDNSVAGSVLTFAGTTNVAGDLTVSGGTMRLNGDLNMTTPGAIIISTNGTINYTNNTTDVITTTGNITLSGGTLGGNATGVANCATLTSTAATSSIIGRGDLTVSGLTLLDGAVNLNSNTGTKLFDDFTVDANGSLTNTAGQNITVGGTFHLVPAQAAFDMGVGSLTLSGAGEGIFGDIGSLIFYDLIVTGTYTNYVDVFTIGDDITGAGTLTNGANKTIRVTDNMSITSFDAGTNNPNTVEFIGVDDQSITTTNLSFRTMIINNTGAAGNSEVTFTSDLSVATLLDLQDGVLDLSGVNTNLTGAAAVQMASGSELWIETQTATVPEITGVFTLAAGSKIMFDGANNQAIDGSPGAGGSDPYQNVEFSGTTTTKTLQSDMTVEGDMTISSSAILNTGANRTIMIEGDWIVTNNTDADPFVQNSGTVNFSGAGAQTLTTAIAGNVETFYNFTRSGGGTLQLLGDNIIVTNTLTMSSGNIDLNGQSCTIGSAPGSPGLLSHGGTSANGWAYGGDFIRYIGTGTMAIPTHSSGLFPIGSSTDYRPFWLAVTSALSTGGTFTVSHTADYSHPVNSVATHTDLSWGGGTDLVGVSNSTWNVASSGITELAGPSFSIRYGGTHFQPFVLTDVNSSLLASTVGTYAACTNANVELEANRTGLTLAEVNGGGTQNFRLGTKDATNSPLPIKLLFFDARMKKNKAVDLFWETSLEINNDYFTIERSTDGMNFEDVVLVDGAGNSSTPIQYSTIDENPLIGRSYYRLKQTDFDGKFTYSNIIYVDFETKKLIPEKSIDFAVVPNPAIGNNFNLNIAIDGQPINEGALIIMRDINGKEIISKMIEGHLVKGSDLVDEIAPGVYMITASNDDKLVHKKVVIH